MKSTEKSTGKSTGKSTEKSTGKSTVKFCDRGRPGAWSRLFFLFSIACGLPLSTLAENSAQVDRLTQQWLDIERQASHLQFDWKAQQPVLNQRLVLLKAEKRQLQALLERSSASEDSVAIRRAELLSEQSELEQQQAQLTRTLTRLTSRLEAVAPMLPPALSAAWQDEQRTLSDDAKVSLQLQVALAQLTSLADFDKRVSVHEGTVSSGDGSTILVKQLYLGAGIAWFVSRDGQQAGWGQAGENGWGWYFDDSVSADEVSKAIDIFEKRQAAELVHLPIRLTGQRTPQSVESAGELQP